MEKERKMTHKEQWSIVWLAVVLTLAMMFFAFFFPLGYGDDTKDKGTSLTDKLLERASEWNINKAINETLQTAERFEK